MSHADDLTADGQDGISFVHPSGELFLQPLAGAGHTHTHM